MINPINNNVSKINLPSSVSFKGQNLEFPVSDKSSFDDKKVSDAMSVSGRSIVKKDFSPAQTPEELALQISEISWLSDEDKCFDFRNLIRIKKNDIPVLSEFFHKADKLTPELKKKINVDSLLSTVAYCSSRDLPSFSPEKFNALNPEIQNKSMFFAHMLICPVKDPDGVNLLYDTLNENYGHILFENPQATSADKAENLRRLKIAQSLNSADKDTADKIDLKKLFFQNNLEPDYISGVFSYLNKLSADGNKSVSSSYINEILNSNYSYALKHSNDYPVCGTEKFKPFETKEEMIKELASLKSENGEWMFSNEDINKIVENGNDYGEMSKILNDFAVNNFNFSSTSLKNILMREGITRDMTASASDLYSKILNDKKYNSFKELCSQSPEFIFNLEPHELLRFENNLPVADVLYDYDKESFLNFPGYSLRCIKDTRINPQTLSDILNSGIFPEKTDPCQLQSFLISDDSADISAENIQLLKDIKNTEELGFLYNGSVSERLSNYAVSECLVKKLPDSFNLKNKPETIKFIRDMHSDSLTNSVFGNFGCGAVYLDFLTKDSGDDVDSARNIVDFIIEHDIRDCESHKFLLSHGSKETYDLIKKFELNPILKGKYDLIPDFGVKLLDDFADICEFAASSESFSNLDTSGFRFILNCFSAGNDFAKENDLGFEINLRKDEIKSNLTLLDEVLKTLHPELRNKVKSDVFADVLTNNSSKPYTLKYDNIAVLNELYSDSRFDKTFGTVYHTYLANFLTADIDRDVILSQKDAMFEFIENNEKNDNIIIDEHTFLSFEGNYNALQSEITKLSNKYPEEKISVTAEKDKVFISTGDEESFIYDKNINLLCKSRICEYTRENGTEAAGYIVNDVDKGIKTYRISRIDPVSDINATEKTVCVYSDKDGRHLKTKQYNQSEVPGFVDIKEILPSGETKIIAESKKTAAGFIAEKHLTSPSGVTTDCFFERSSNAKEKFINIIKDSDGNLLSFIERSSENVDSDKKITSVNGREYQIHYGADDITVKDVNNNTTYTLSLSKINPGRNATIYNLLKELPGDELIIMQNFVNKIELTDRIDSCINPVNRTMYVGPHSFIFEHEFGHGKDELIKDEITFDKIINADVNSRIASDEKLCELFNSEKKALYDNAPSSVIEEVGYFVADAKHHYGGEKGGLKETIAEVNGIQSGVVFHPLLNMRTQILQEYFPQTVAYLNNRFLLP